MVDFDKLAETAQRLVEANGRDVVLFRKDRAPANAAQPWRGPDMAAPDPAGGIGPVKIAFVPASGSGFGKVLEDQDPTIRIKIDEVGLLASNSFEDLGITFEQVEECDTLRDGSHVYKIVSRGHLRPATKSMLFVLGLEI
jgi:hypothetical protein